MPDVHTCDALRNRTNKNGILAGSPEELAEFVKFLDLSEIQPNDDFPLFGNRVYRDPYGDSVCIQPCEDGFRIIREDTMLNEPRPDETFMDIDDLSMEWSIFLGEILNDAERRIDGEPEREDYEEIDRIVREWLVNSPDRFIGIAMSYDSEEKTFKPEGGFS